MKVGSLFAGIGGIDLGFQQAGFDILWANEIDRDACKTYKLNFPETKLFEGDLRKLDAAKLENVDIITAGFPCQPFSVCGNQKGFGDDRGNLFFEIMRIADAIEPKIIFLENVANLVKHDKGRTFNVIHNELVSRGYYLRYLVADACDYGIPQHRTRTYILAFRDVERCESYRFSDYGIQSGKDGICFTLKANMGTWYDRVPIIKDNYGIRTITPKECLALMGFPKNFKIANITPKSAYKQIGNSVCVPIIKKTAKQIYSL